MSGMPNNIIIAAIVLFMLLISAVCIFLKIYHLKHPVSLMLIDHLDDEVNPNDYVMSELNDCYTEIAIRIFEVKKKTICTQDGRYRNAFLQCRDNVRRKFRPRVLSQYVKSNFDTYVTLTFSDEFKVFVKQNYPDAEYDELFSVLLMYFDALNPSVSIMERRVNNEYIVEKFYQCFETAMEKNLANQIQVIMEEKQQEEKLSESIKYVYNKTKQNKSKIKDYQDAYRNSIVTIQNNGNVGLLPPVWNTKTITRSLFNHIAAQPVIGQKRFIDIASNLDYEEILGCYVIYNTYTGKYFVGKARRPIHRAYAVLKGEVKTNSILLSYEFADGNMMLVKSIPLDGSGFESLDELQKTLVIAYNSLYPNGYNVVNKKL